MFVGRGVAAPSTIPVEGHFDGFGCRRLVVIEAVIKLHHALVHPAAADALDVEEVLCGHIVRGDVLAAGAATERERGGNAAVRASDRPL